MATAQVGYTSKPPDARRNGRTQELRDSFSRARGAQRWRFFFKEVSGLKQMMEDMKETVAGLHLEDKGAETGSRVTTTGVSQDREERAGNSRTEDTDTGIEDKGEGRTEDRTEICAGMMTGVSQDREETDGNRISEDTDTGIEDEGEGRTE